MPWVGGSKYHLSNNKEFRFFSDWHVPNSTSEWAHLEWGIFGQKLKNFTKILQIFQNYKIK
jgi:hypothetical protein